MPDVRGLIRVASRMLVSVAALSLAACNSSTTAVSPSTTAAPAPSTAPPTAASTIPSTTTSITTPPSTTEAPVTAGAIVKVANCSDVNGAAGVLTDEIAARGFETREPTNGAGIDRSLEVSKIYVVPGSEAVARSLSRLMGGLELFEMPIPAWIKDGTAGLGDATVLVMLGHDLAGKRLADMAG